MSAVLLLGGIQIIMIGGLGLYIGAIFREVKVNDIYCKDIIKIKNYFSFLILIGSFF